MKFGEEKKQIGVLSEFFGDFKFQNFQIQPRLYEISLLGTGFLKKPVPKVITLVAPVFYKKPVLDPLILAPVFIKNRCYS